MGRTLSACKEILDRGYGKSLTPVAASVATPKEISDEDWVALLGAAATGEE